MNSQITIPPLDGVEGYYPKQETICVSVLLYADDAILLSCAQKGLKQLMLKCFGYLASSNLQMNSDQSTSFFFSFSKTWKLFTWNYEGIKIAQVKQYLGIQFHFKYSCVHHGRTATNLAKCTARSLVVFIFLTTAAIDYVPALLRIFLTGR